MHCQDAASSNQAAVRVAQLLPCIAAADVVCEFLYAGMTQQNEQLRMQVAALLQETQYKVRPIHCCANQR